MWYYIHEGRQYGPVSGAEIKKLAAGGQLLPTDLVWKDGMPEWVPASRIKGIIHTFGCEQPVAVTAVGSDRIPKCLAW
jgi:hypothetical protein